MTFKRALMAALLAVAFASSAYAGVIIGASGVTSSGGVFPASHIVDQSGLSANYISGATDFDTYVSSTKSSFSFPNLLELGDTAALGYFVFDLGSAMAIDRTAIWNQSGTASLDRFTLESSLTSDFAVSVALGSFEMSGPLLGCDPCSADVFSFSAVNAQYIRLNVLSNAGLPNATRLNEVAFREAGTAIPEPGSLALVGVALAGLAVSRRRT